MAEPVKSNDEREDNNQVAVAAVPNVEASPQIFKLDIDCCEELLDWLSLVDLHSFGQSCTTLEQVAGHVFKQTYPKVIVVCGSDGIYIDTVQMNGFCDFIQHLTFRSNNMGPFVFTQSRSFKSVKNLGFHHMELTCNKVECIKHILANVEEVELYGCTLNGDFYENFLKFCPNLNSLTIGVYYTDANVDLADSRMPLIGADNSWLLREYPNLKCFTLYGSLLTARLAELNRFFEMNPSIRKFTTNGQFFLVGPIKDCKLDLDDLIILMNGFDTITFYLTNIYEKISQTIIRHTGSFKRLHLYVNELNKDEVKRFNKIETLHTSSLTADSAAGLTNLKALSLGSDEVNHHEISTLINLERAIFTRVSPVDILAYISGLAKLQQIEVKQLIGTDIIDVRKLNKERKQLPGARKVLLYVDKTVYLATKWSGMEMDCDLVGMKRLDSIDCGKSLDDQSIRKNFG
ncbi:uncharacterized protein LOC129573826 [Sitodiplosis mosellana]|uniref:uncharacterized protein LOC129573826 n=1 Tax=Sitodiplosis mosellana TaxID=263140 RepID=UPI002443A4DA|nr:uncharacterized protein LOC129573826 [Sitodiplosis mosellana]